MAFLLPKEGCFALFRGVYNKNTGLPGWFLSLQAFFAFSSKIQIVQFIPLSFNLWGIVQFIGIFSTRAREVFLLDVSVSLW
ncbi:MAG: hypothetical protein J5993_01185 [Clostridia bacterium]|nr:hypothetical protein [Clostridia bacterium]